MSWFFKTIIPTYIWQCLALLKCSRYLFLKDYPLSRFLKNLYKLFKSSLKWNMSYWIDCHKDCLSRREALAWQGRNHQFDSLVPDIEKLRLFSWLKSMSVPKFKKTWMMVVGDCFESPYNLVRCQSFPARFYCSE